MDRTSSNRSANRTRRAAGAPASRRASSAPAGDKPASKGRRVTAQPAALSVMRAEARVAARMDDGEDEETLDTGAYLDGADDVDDSDDFQDDGDTDESDEDEDGFDDEAEDDDEDAPVDDDMDEAEDDMADEERVRPRDEYSASSYLDGQRIYLPSGKYVRVRPVSLIGLINQGMLPPNLLAAARRMVYGNEAAQDNRMARRQAARAYGGQRQKDEAVTKKQALEVVDHLCMHAIASFRVVDCKPGRERAGQVSVHAMYEADKIAIANFCMKGQRALRPFRGK